MILCTSQLVIDVFAVVCLSQRTSGLVASMFNKSRSSSTTIFLRASLSPRHALVALSLCSNRENYIHRIGRSGRFGRKGVAINVGLFALFLLLLLKLLTLLSSQFVTVEDVRILRDIEQFYSTQIVGFRCQSCNFISCLYFRRMKCPSTQLSWCKLLPWLLLLNHACSFCIVTNSSVAATARLLFKIQPIAHNFIASLPSWKLLIPA